MGGDSVWAYTDGEPRETGAPDLKEESRSDADLQAVCRDLEVLPLDIIEYPSGVQESQQAHPVQRWNGKQGIPDVDIGEELIPAKQAVVPQGSMRIASTDSLGKSIAPLDQVERPDTRRAAHDLSDHACAELQPW